MPIILMPDGTEVEFPDDMPREEIRLIIASRFPDAVGGKSEHANAEAAMPRNIGRGVLESTMRNAAPLIANVEGGNIPPHQQMPLSAARTVLEQGMQGATGNYGDEIMDWLGAAYAKNAPRWMGGRPDLMQDVDPNELYREARGMSSERLNRQMKEHPVSSVASNIAGGLATGVAGSTTKTGVALTNRLRAGSGGQRAAKGFALGATTGAIYGHGAGEEGARGKSALYGAAVGGGIGGAFPLAGAGLRRLNTRTIVPGADEVKHAASRMYQQADELGGVLTPDFTNKFIENIESMIPQTEIGRAVGGDSLFTQLSERLSTIRGKPMTLQAAQEVDELLGDAIDGLIRDGRLTKAGKKLFDMQSTFRNMIENADESLIMGGPDGFQALKEARKLWGIARRMEDVERIIQNAETYQVPSTAIKTGFRNIVKNPNRLRGYTPVEIKAMKKAAQTGIVTDVLNVMGSRLGALGAGVAGYAATGPVGGMASALGAHAMSAGARKASTALQRGRANNAIRTIAERSGMVKREQKIPFRTFSTPDGRVLTFEEVVKLPPAEAKRYLNRNSQK